MKKNHSNCNRCARRCGGLRLLESIKFSWNVNLLQCLELSLGASELRFVHGL